MFFAIFCLSVDSFSVFLFLFLFIQIATTMSLLSVTYRRFVRVRVSPCMNDLVRNVTEVYL